MTELRLIKGTSLRIKHTNFLSEYVYCGCHKYKRNVGEAARVQAQMKSTVVFRNEAVI